MIFLGRTLSAETTNQPDSHVTSTRLQGVVLIQFGIEISSQHVFLYCLVFYKLSLNLNKRKFHLLMGCGILSQYCALYPR